MNSKTMPIIYAVLALFAIGLGLFVANLFGSSVATTPAQSNNSGASAAASTSVPTMAATTAATAAATQAPTSTSAPTAAATAVPTAATTEPTAAVPTAQTTEPPAAPTSDTAAPAATEQATATSAYTEYTVQPGDSLKAIAQRYNVTLQQILAVNDIPNPDSLTVGTVIKIPSP